MGLDYAFDLVASRGGVDVLLGALAERVGPACASKLRRASPWSPQTPHAADAGVRGMRPAFGIANYYDLSLVTPIDAEVRRYLVGSGQRADARRAGEAEIGLVYMKLYAGRTYARCTLTAATSDMSRLFAASQELRRRMISAARAGQARALFLDAEDDASWELMYPAKQGGARVPRPAMERLERPEELDQHCARALELAGLA